MKCSKCGSSNINVEYVPPNQARRYNTHHWPPKLGDIILGEHLAKQCNSCSYAWPEPCLKEEKKK